MVNSVNVIKYKNELNSAVTQLKKQSDVIVQLSSVLRSVFS